MESLMKNFNKKLTLLVAIAMVASSVQPTWIGDKFSVISAGTKSGLMSAYSYVPAMPTMPTMPAMPAMPTLTGIQSGVMNAGSAIVSGTKSGFNTAGSAILNGGSALAAKTKSGAVIAGAAIVAGSKKVLEKANANKGAVAAVTFVAAAAGTAYVLKQRQLAKDAEENAALEVVTTPVVEIATEVVTTPVVEIVTEVVEIAVVDLNAQAAKLSARDLMKFAKLSAEHKAAALTQVNRLNDAQIAHIS